MHKDRYNKYSSIHHYLISIVRLPCTKSESYTLICFNLSAAMVKSICNHIVYQKSNTGQLHNQFCILGYFSSWDTYTSKSMANIPTIYTLCLRYWTEQILELECMSDQTGLYLHGTELDQLNISFRGCSEPLCVYCMTSIAVK